MKHLCYICLIGLFVAIVAHSTSTDLVELTEVVVHLKNGVTIPGTIVSLIPDVSVTSRLSNGEVMEIPTSDIQELKREATVIQSHNTPTYGHKSPGHAVGLSFFSPA